MKRPWYEIKAKAEDRAEVYIYEQIGEDLFGEGVVAKQFVEELAALEVAQIDLHINSPGGSVFDGQAIFNAIDRHPANVTSYIDGVAASIASVVALAGDRVVMARNALFMIHDPFALTVGTAADMRKMADVLDQVAQTILGVYVAKTGADEEEIASAMAAETWYSADEALATGFVDEVAEPLRLAALQRWDFKALGFRNAPTIEPEDAGRVLSAANERKLREARDLIDHVLEQVSGDTSDTTDKSTTEPAAEAGAEPAAEAQTPSDLVLVGGNLYKFRRS